MTARRVRVNARYRFEPVPYDQFDPPYGVTRGYLKSGDIVRVKNCPGCPPANTMGMCHVETLAGQFAGTGLYKLVEISLTVRRTPMGCAMRSH